MHPGALSKAQFEAFKNIDTACRQIAALSGQVYEAPPLANPQSPPDLLLLHLSERVASALTLLVGVLDKEEVR